MVDLFLYPKENKGVGFDVPVDTNKRDESFGSALKDIVGSGLNQADKINNTSCLGCLA